MSSFQFFNPAAWYWFVGADQTQVYSSAGGSFVLVADAAFQTWLAAGNNPTTINGLPDLAGVLAQFKLRPTDQTMLTAYQQALIALLDEVILRIEFNHENRIRVLEAKPPITRQQFITAVAALL